MFQFGSARPGRLEALRAVDEVELLAVDQRAVELEHLVAPPHRSDQLGRRDPQAGLLGQLPRGGLGQPFARLHLAAHGEPPLGCLLAGQRRVRPAQQQHGAAVVEQHHPGRGAVVEHAVIAVRQRVRPLHDLEIAGQRGRSTEMQQPHQAPFGQGQRVADRVVVEAAGQQHPGLGVGQLGDQPGRQRRRVDGGQRGRQLVLTRLAGGPGRGLGGVGQRRQPAPLGGTAVGVDRHGARHHRAPGQRAIERLPGQVVADVQPVQPIGGPVRPDADHRQHRDQDRDADHQPCHQLATSTLAPVAATVSYTRMIWLATTDQS
ncbi:hypothetical protein PICSAR154_02787 [Mycobacterium avium subsp. paratuberculosis]|nr:hypothetical protein PICSAR154_02787 [Mycobacterium avium subsp. paratuberculosis]